FCASGWADPGTAPGNGIPFRSSDLPTLTSCPPQRPLLAGLGDFIMQTPTEVLDPTAPTPAAANGSSPPQTIPHATENGLNGDAHGLTELLHALQAMRVGDFSVRMAGDRVGI